MINLYPKFPVTVPATPLKQTTAPAKAILPKLFLFLLTAFCFLSPAARAQVGPTDALLTSIKLTPASTLVGTKGPGYANYNTAVASTTSSVTVTPTVQDAAATIKVNGITVASGVASAPIALAFGSTVINTVVTAPNGKTTKAYTITATRAPSSNALLSSISLSPALTLVGATGPGYLNYTAVAANGTTSIQVIPTAQDASATIKVNGTTVTSGSASSPIALNVGDNIITTIIKAQDGTTTKTVIITVNRVKSSNAGLAGLGISGGTLAPVFATGSLSYTASVPFTTTSVEVTPTTGDATATVTVNGLAVASGSASGNIALNVGLNTISTKVTAQNGITTRTYTTTIRRAAASTNALLTSISLSPALPLTGTTGPGYLNYNASVALGTPTIEVIPVAKDPTATIKVNGITVISGSASQPIALSSNSNVITTVITAQDGVTTKTIIITVNVLPLPTVSYNSPNTYTAGAAIPALTPTSTNVSALGKSNILTTLGSGFNGPQGVAIDASGNVYVGDNANNAVKEIPANGTAPVSLASGFSGPAGVAVDAMGNVYVADLRNNVVKEIPVGSTTAISIAFRLKSPTGVAVDAVGHVYIADWGNNAIKEMNPNGDGTTITISTAFRLPHGIAVDGNDNLYVVDAGHTQVTKLPAGGGAPIMLGAGFANPSAVAVDAAGNVYVTDEKANTVTEIPVGGGVQFIIGSGFYLPDGVAVSAAGNVYVADMGNNAIKEINKLTGGYFINPALPAGLSFNNTTGAIRGTPTAGSAATNYTVTAFNTVGSGSTTVSIEITLPPLPTVSYADPNTYTVGKLIKPLATTSTGVTASGFSQLPVSLNPGAKGTNGVAVDVAGNVYVATSGNNSIMKTPAGGGAAVVFASGFNFPSDVVVDAAGNVYEADGGSGKVMEVLAGTTTPVTIATGLGFPSALALDAANNIYVADGSTKILKIAASGHTVTTIASGFNGPFGVAIDGNNNIYVTDFTNSLFEIPATGGPRITINTGFNNNNGVRVDGAGNVYVADSGNGVVKIFAPGSKTPTALNYRMSFPFGMAFDHSGALYVSDATAGFVYKFNPTGGYYISPNLPAGLSFNGNTGLISGTPTVVSPATNYTITGYNPAGGTVATVSIAVNPPALPTVSYTGPNVYTVNTPITPLAPKNSGGTVAATAYGTNPAVIGATFGFKNPEGLALDAAGNIYVVDGLHNTIKEIPVGGGAPVIFGSGFNSPLDVAVDAAGNLYVADGANGDIKEIPAGNGTPVILASGLSFPSALALDVTGNIYAADGNTSIVKIPAGGGTPVTVASGFNGPFGVALDAAGNIYVTDSGNALYKVPVGGGATIILAANLNNPNHVKVDPSGNIYVADSGNGVVRIFPANGGAQTAVNYVMGFPFGMAIDPAGDLYVSDDGTNNIFKFTPSGGYYISPALPMGLSFNNTTGIISGTPTATSPAATYNITGYNLTGGNTATVSIQVKANANLANLALNSGTLTPGFAAGTLSYTANVPNATTTITVTQTTADVKATVMVNGTAVVSGSASAAIALATGNNNIAVVVTAVDGITTQTYSVAVNRAATTGTNSLDQLISVTNPAENVAIDNDGLTVHPGVSPNGDGVNDVFTIEGLAAYPNNKVAILNRNGVVIFEATGYDNSTKAFDGHSNKNGKMQLPGTYFYSLDYTVNGENKHKTGYIILKY